MTNFLKKRFQLPPPSKSAQAKYEENWDRIFGNSKETCVGMGSVAEVTITRNGELLPVEELERELFFLENGQPCILVDEN